MSHAIDLALMALAATSMRWQLVALAMLLIAVRRWSWLCRGLLALPAGWPWYAPSWEPGPLLCLLFPGMESFMSSADDEGTSSQVVRNQPEPPEPGAVLPRQNQVEPIEPGKNEPARQGPFWPNLAPQDDDQMIAYLAQLRRPNGEYRLSANKILEIVGGTAAETKKKIAQHRPDISPPVRSLQRPNGGW